MKRQATILILLALLLTSCARILKPAYLEGRPAWQKAVFWAGPGH
jgi:hypothetical protein